MSAPSSTRMKQFITEIVFAASTSLIAYFAIRSLLSRLDTEAPARAEAKRKADEADRKIKGILASKGRRQDEDENGLSFGDDRPSGEELKLTQYEQAIAMEVVAPKEIPVSFEDIGGLDDIIEELKESVIYPLTMPQLYAHSSSLLAAPSGVLLYGPPGCGKTMMAKALAHQSGAVFINLHISTLTEKWYGDSNKLVSAVFSLARKLQPAIVFIDEIDAVLGQRRSGEHEASGMVKAEFMTHWDGLASTNASGTPQRICILGATNRIQDIDEAILRRMPKKFPVSLPNASQRRRIFKLILRGTKVDKSNFDLDYLVKVTNGMSGSDIKESCRDAAMLPVREFINEKRQKGQLLQGVDAKQVRGVRTGDFFRKAATTRKQVEVDSGDEDTSSVGKVLTETDHSEEESEAEEEYEEAVPRSR